MTHVDGTPSLWPCCGAWECVCAVPDLLDTVILDTGDDLT